MKAVLMLGVLALGACTGGPRAPENANSVPNVQRSINETRQTNAYIYMTGGVYDGAAAGQTATFVVTPDDTLVCTFQTDTVIAGDLATVTAHRLNVRGVYAALADIVLPNVTATQVELTPNFTVETGSAAGFTSTAMGFGDPRFDRLMAFFAASPTPCWAFG